MKILPVIDLLDGMVVRGVAGQRESYQPVESKISPSAEPAAVAAALYHRGCREVYLADLDSIMHQKLSTAAIRQVMDAGLGIWLDAGLRRAEDVSGWPVWLQDQVRAAVLGTESVACDQLEPLVRRWQQRAVVSLDLMDGKMLGQWASHAPLEVADRAYHAGCRRFIVLDLGQVGMSEGVSTLSLCRQLRQAYPDTEITSGGGVRNNRDLDALQTHGCDHALVASAIHAGRLRLREH